MMNKLGIFGDSFADLNPADLTDKTINRIPWPCHLSNLLNAELTCFAKASTSTWWSYQKFLENFENFDTIIFCYSEYNRWHTLADGFQSLAGLIYEDRLEHHEPHLREMGSYLLKVRPILDDEKFNKFIYQNIFNDINLQCKKHNKKLVNILTFDHIWGNQDIVINVSGSYGPVITGMAEISFLEFHYGPNFHKIYRNKPDRRHCHMNPNNNFVIANIIKETLEGSNTLQKLFEDTRLSFDEKHLEYLINEV